MTLATDILKRASADLTPHRQPKEPGQRTNYLDRYGRGARPPSKVRTKEYPVPEHEPVKGTYFEKAKGDWGAVVWEDGKAKRIGYYASQERAAIAVRLYDFWKRNGFIDIPNKPEIRPYCKRKIAD